MSVSDLEILAKCVGERWSVGRKAWFDQSANPAVQERLISERLPNRMPVNLDRPEQWKADIIRAVDMYNDWFMKFAPKAFRTTRIQTTKDVESTLHSTDNMTNIQPALLKVHPEILATLRMSTCPPIAVDRLIGLARVSTHLVKCMELKKKLPERMDSAEVDSQLAKISGIIEKLADPDIFVWLGRREAPTEAEIHRAATIVADRLCGAVANPIIRNAQEKRQLAAIKSLLEARGYKQIALGGGTGLTKWRQQALVFE